MERARPRVREEATGLLGSAQGFAPSLHPGGLHPLSPGLCRHPMSHLLLWLSLRSKAWSQGSCKPQDFPRGDHTSRMHGSGE